MSFVQKPITDAIAELQRLADLFGQRREQLARAVGISVQQWYVLEEISDEHFMPSMFARRRESSAAAVSKIIRQLLDKGLVDVAVDGKDGRVRRYTLTADGRQVMEQLRTKRREAIDVVWGSLSPDKLLEFQQFASELSDRMEKYSEQEKQPVAQTVGRVI